MKQSAPRRILETDLYPPLQAFFTAQGFTVNSEVKHCDLVAVKGEQIVIVEMKSSFNATLLIQATKRQKMTDTVYIAIPQPKSKRSRAWQDLCHLVRRLELGMLLVDLERQPAVVEVALEPLPFDRAKSLRQGKRHTTSLLNEVRDRHGDYNIGGSNRRKLMTAYKENSFQIACYLEQHGPLSPRKLQGMGTGKKTPAILQKNYYGWFERIAKGLYQVTPAAQAFLRQYPELFAYYCAQLTDKPEN